MRKQDHVKITSVSHMAFISIHRFMLDRQCPCYTPHNLVPLIFHSLIGNGHPLLGWNDTLPREGGGTHSLSKEASSTLGDSAVRLKLKNVKFLWILQITLVISSSPVIWKSAGCIRTSFKRCVCKEERLGCAYFLVFAMFTNVSISAWPALCDFRLSYFNMGLFTRSSWMRKRRKRCTSILMPSCAHIRWHFWWWIYPTLSTTTWERPVLIALWFTRLMIGDRIWSTTFCLPCTMWNVTIMQWKLRAS